MKTVSLEAVFSISPEIVVRTIDGEILIVPLTNRVAAGADHLFSLNETGREIWGLFDGSRSLRNIIASLEKKYKFDKEAGTGKPGPIELDVVGLTRELLERHMLVETSAPLEKPRSDKPHTVPLPNPERPPAKPSTMNHPPAERSRTKRLPAKPPRAKGR